MSNNNPTNTDDLLCALRNWTPKTHEELSTYFACAASMVKDNVKFLYSDTQKSLISYQDECMLETEGDNLDQQEEANPEKPEREYAQLSPDELRGNK